MPLPENFSPWEQLQTAWMRIHNRQVKEWFREDISDDSYNTPESALKLACTMKDDDTSSMMLSRFILFYFYTGFLFNKITDYAYLIPKTTFHDSIVFKPQIQFHFQEPYIRRKNSSGNKTPKRMLLSCRWFINPDKITEGHIQTLRNKINSEFDNFEHYCGYILYSYKDNEQFLEMFCHASNSSDASNLFSKVIDVLQSVPNDIGDAYRFKNECVKEHKPLKRPIENNETITVAGDKVKKHRNIKLGYVILKSARLEIQNWYGDNLLFERGRV